MFDQKLLEKLNQVYKTPPEKAYSVGFNDAIIRYWPDIYKSLKK